MLVSSRNDEAMVASTPRIYTWPVQLPSESIDLDSGCRKSSLLQPIGQGRARKCELNRPLLFPDTCPCHVYISGNLANCTRCRPQVTDLDDIYIVINTKRYLKSFYLLSFTSLLPSPFLYGWWWWLWWLWWLWWWWLFSTNTFTFVKNYKYNEVLFPSFIFEPFFQFIVSEILWFFFFRIDDMMTHTLHK